MSDERTLAALADELALVIAKARTKGSVYMDGSHNPLPSERIAAERFMELVVANADLFVAADRARIRAEVEGLRREKPWPLFVTAADMAEAARTANNNVVDDVLAIIDAGGSV